MSTSIKTSGAREASATHDRLGRPKLPPFSVRKPKPVRYNELEWTVITARAKAVGKSPTVYVRETSLSKEVSVSPTRKADPELVTKLEQLSAEIRMMGNVVNQVARDIHTGRQVDQEWDLMPDEIKQTLTRIQNTVDDLVLGNDT